MGQNLDTWEEEYGNGGGKMLGKRSDQIDTFNNSYILGVLTFLSMTGVNDDEKEEDG